MSAPQDEIPPPPPPPPSSSQTPTQQTPHTVSTIKLPILKKGEYDIVYVCCVGYVRFDNQSIERDRLIGIEFVLDFVEFISSTLVRYSEDIDYFKDFENEFLAIVYNDALASDHKISSESPDSGNDNDKVNIELPSDDASIKPSDSIINANIDTESHEFNGDFETNHDTPDGRYGVSNPMDTAY
ncbi:hypothetical protein Tco_1079317 [Tanacetum coccineum]|uniref:Uncharacterized protein n=1 Tax=Tanacetum coccineum TaxID=301880 RepID=A0ABQ5HT03_9ASTR